MLASEVSGRAVGDWQVSGAARCLKTGRRWSARRRNYSCMKMAAGIISPNIYSDEEEVAILESTSVSGDVKKQLLPDFSVISSANNVQGGSHLGDTAAETSQEVRIKVYLRVRPFTEAELEKGESQDCVLIENSEKLVLRAPKASFAMKSSERGIGQAMHKFTFTQVWNKRFI
ncbi:kinesin-like protein KIF20A isoform X3 [Leucoraja erinacea]|uniref:kinesin-like protein KIF20A isoform X3 n=1 Tax=Leucoraja erinaceus TaxID=7782 RepID=UPI002454B0B5|nr:kinesin-like protein KIF20A isoform X3 [Leucoraja erinacea]